MCLGSCLPWLMFVVHVWQQVIGDKMDEFEEACNKAYLAIRKQQRQLLQLLELSSFSAGPGTALPCLEGDALDEVKKRLKLSLTDRLAQQVPLASQLCCLGASPRHVLAFLLPRVCSCSLSCCYMCFVCWIDLNAKWRVWRCGVSLGVFELFASTLRLFSVSTVPTSLRRVSFCRMWCGI